MNLSQRFVYAALILGFSFSHPAYALENTSTVKVTPVLKTTTSWDGTALHYPEGQAEITGLIVEIAPGGDTGWHLHPVPSFGLMLEGTLEVTLKDGRVRRIQAGESLAEVADTLHIGRNVGEKPVKLVVFYAGASGKPLTVKQADEQKTPATPHEK